MKAYRYGLRARPAGPGATPPYDIPVKYSKTLTPRSDQDSRYGCIYFPRPLDPEVVAEFELVDLGEVELDDADQFIKLDPDRKYQVI